MRIFTLSTDKSAYVTGEPVCLTVILEKPAQAGDRLRIQIQHLAEKAEQIDIPLEPDSEVQEIPVLWQPPAYPAGYGVLAELFSQEGICLSQSTTAFDVLPTWSAFPRYGFLTDFSAGRADPRQTLAKLSRFHINGLQFYDWLYRHDELLAPQDDYLDPLGRPMSLQTVRTLVAEAHHQGMAAMPYLAIYAASAAYGRSHLAEALFDHEGKAIPFGEDFLALMNPAPGSPWANHLLAECDRMLQAVPFDGLHIDQYGEPHQAWDCQGLPVDLPAAFNGFIQAARQRHPQSTILFNAVGNWPIETLAASPLDFLYIEIWPPETQYRDVARIVLDAVRLSEGKPVVIALYLPASHPENVLLADAVITACGGSRIELGESNRLLADPYFPKHEAISPSLLKELVQTADFRVRYGEWLQAYRLTTEQRQNWSQSEFRPDWITFSQPLWSVVRQYPDGLAVNLVNFSGLDSEDQHWDTQHPLPSACQNVSVTLRCVISPHRIVWVCPENGIPGSPVDLPFEVHNKQISFVIPSIQLSGIVFIYE